MAKSAKKQPEMSPEGKSLKVEGKAWIDRIESGWKREEIWKKDAEAAVKAYTNESGSDARTGKLYDYNILHSNVETIVPAIINSAPIPNVRRRFGDDDPVAKTVGDIIERAIMVQVDDSRLDAELEGQAHDAFLAGRGVLRLRFHAETQETDTSAQDEAEDIAEGEQDEADDAPPNVPDDVAVTGERLTFEAVSWRDYQHGPCKRWEDRPWESFRHVMQCEDAKSFADETLVKQQTGPDGDLFGEAGSDLVMYEIWNRDKKEVIFVSDKGDVLKRIADPLGWSGFYPTIRPVQPIEIVGRTMPVNPFSIYKKLADELDILTKRISVITAAMKVKGAFLGGVANDLMAWATADDNELIPINNVEMLAQMQGGIAGALTWWPVEKFQPVLAELFKNRDLTKSAIYEITGISDIVRGASSASETATAQQIKTQWGSLRIRKMQRMIERSARDLFVAMAEIIPAKFSLRTLERMTGIPILPKPTDTPEQVQQKTAVMLLLRQPLATYYRVDVESNSTVRADLTQKKQEMNEFLAGTASFFTGMAPIAQSGPAAMEGILTLYNAALGNFDLGRSAEDAVSKMVEYAKVQAEQARTNPQPPQPSEAELKAQVEGAKAQAAGAKAQADAQRAQADAQIAMKDLEIKEAAAASDARIRELEIASSERQNMLDNITKIVAARIAAQTDVDSATLEADLARELGLTTMAHDQIMAANQQAHERALQAAQPQGAN